MPLSTDTGLCILTTRAVLTAESCAAVLNYFIFDGGYFVFVFILYLCFFLVDLLLVLQII